MKRCTRCVMPDTRPDTPFVDGVCAACLSYAQRPTIDWEARKAELVQLLDRHDGRCIVPSSGGKDSTYIALRLKELGCDVTAVTATTCCLTPIGRANLDNLARHVRTIEVTPNRAIRAKLCQIGMKLVGDASWPQHASIWAIPFRMACALRTPLLIWGENPQAAYGGPIGSEDARQMTRRWCAEFGGLNGLRASDIDGLHGITQKDLIDYQLPSDAEIREAGVEAHFLGAYEPWSSHRNAKVSMEHGMRAELPCAANWWAFENLDCWVTFAHDVAMYRKYGFGRGCAQISVDVREGRVERDWALEWVRKYDGLLCHTYAGVSLAEGLQFLGMTEAEFVATLDKFTDWNLFAGADGARPLLKEFA